MHAFADIRVFGDLEFSQPWPDTMPGILRIRERDSGNISRATLDIHLAPTSSDGPTAWQKAAEFAAAVNAILASLVTEAYAAGEEADPKNWAALVEYVERSQAIAEGGAL